jgi:flagellin
MQKQTKEMDSAMARLSSGLRINSAKDDAAGSAIASKMEAQVRSLGVAIRNANDAISLTQTAEGALGEVENILQRMRELAVQSSSGGLASADKDYLHVEMTQLIAEVNEVAKNTRFNDMQVLTGTQFKFYHDIDVAGTSIDTVAASLTTVAIGITIAAVSIGSKGRAVSASIDKIDTALNTLAEKRANLGAVSNRFDHIVDNLTNVVANTETAKSRIEDADFAVETIQLTRNTVLQQAATSMITQANASKNTILALIQG